MKGHLFILTKDVLDAISEEETEATVAGLKEMNLYHLPYPKISLQLPAEFFRATPELIEARNRDPESYPIINPDGTLTKDCEGLYTIIHNLTISSFDKMTAESPGTSLFRKFSIPIPVPNPQEFLSQVRDCLIVLLATRNAVKTTTRDKLAALNIGKGKSRYEYTTTISLPGPEAITESTSSGRTVRPHLRRGHVRRQRYGPQRSYTRMTWIDPTFVNADENFINTRTAYNLSPSIKKEPVS